MTGARFAGLLVINILLHKFVVAPFLARQTRRGVNIASIPYALGVVGFFTLVAEIWFVFCAAAGVE